MNGLKCPGCGEDNIIVEATTWLSLTRNEEGKLEGGYDGNDPYHDFLFHNDSAVYCGSCSWEGALAEAGGDLLTEAEQISENERPNAEIAASRSDA